MQILINGEQTELVGDATLMAVITLLELEGKRYAIEVNEEIISRGDHANYSLNADDRVEVVQAIGGG